MNLLNRLSSILVAVAAVFLLASSVQAKGRRGEVIPGVDVLAQQNFEILKGKRVGLITNHTGLTRDNRSTIDVLAEAPQVNLVALFSPEHGIRGEADEKVASGKDEKTGLHVFSLYGETRKPTPEMLKDIDVLVFDIQDIGTRFYTYIGTMGLAMQAAAEQKKGFVVLDRPNPIGGHKVEGAVSDPANTGGITAIYPIPTRHGMTVGELAKMFNEHFKIGCELNVVPVKNWDRRMYWDETGLLWVNPSPNMKTLNGAILYPGLGAGETTTLSCGRGTDRPFEIYGAPFMNSWELAAELESRNIPGIRFVGFPHTPTAKYHQFVNQRCEGIFAIITDREELDTFVAGMHMIQAMHKLYPNDYKALGGFKTSWGDQRIWTMLTEENKTPEEVKAFFEPDMKEFMKVRKKYLMY